RRFKRARITESYGNQYWCKESKAEELKINVIIIDESHTSKCSFLDNESINVMTLTWERESKEEYSEHQIEH
ncbi:MAG: hypothetical protein QXQ25_05835, partial [Thermoplasmata archaeon]